MATSDAFARGRFRRALNLSKLGAELAVRQAQRLVARDPAAAHRAVAETLAKELGAMKGLPMKIGQILSYMEGVLPEEYRATYQEVLGTLRVRAAPVDSAACLQILTDELGARPEQAFERFDPEPIASASIGQVYRARFEGREVCVKVQYPGIKEAVDSDLANLDGIMGLVHAVMPGIDTAAMVEDFKARLHEESDYLQEASYQRRFAEIYRADPDLLIPEVIDARSTQRVLTTVFLDGAPIERFLPGAPQAARDRAGQALFRMAFGTLLEQGLFHADPHPGNLLFECGPERRLGVLDFGCVQPVEPQAQADLADLICAALEGRDLMGPTEKALGISEVDDTTRRVVVDITRQVLAPILAPQPYRFTREAARALAKEVTDAKLKLAGKVITRRARLGLEREGVMFVVRNLFGLASIWGTLETQGDFRAITEQLLAGAPDAPAS
ncbi:MAG: AarF/ABC1/UbiB kinase family protein [Deltaproteobacteria bacterium]|nr:AarF/ABC1/UbiB kinase family protein [Deltaproteobacteria bacterium]